jgi:hypothetical protein
MEAWIRRYPPDVIPPLWTKLAALIAGGTLRASEEVGHDLAKKSDDLHRWTQAQAGLFIPSDERVQEAAAGVLAVQPKLIDTRKGRSASDPFVIAAAQVHGGSVLTEEKASGSTTRPKIPDVCKALGVPVVNLLDLIRQQGWVFK